MSEFIRQALEDSLNEAVAETIRAGFNVTMDAAGNVTVEENLVPRLAQVEAEPVKEKVKRQKAKEPEAAGIAAECKEHGIALNKNGKCKKCLQRKNYLAWKARQGK